MKSAQTIYKQWKYHIYGFLVIIFVQAMAVPVINAFLKEFIKDSNIRKIALLIILLIYVLVDTIFLFRRVVLLRRLLNTTPIKCELEDIILVGYKDENRTKYVPFFIVESIANKKLYLTYDRYSLLDCTAIINYSEKKKISCTVYNGKGLPLQLGDIVGMYMLNIVDIPVSIDYSKNIVKLKRKKFYFHHMNEQIGIDVFKHITFYEGGIDLDASFPQ